VDGSVNSWKPKFLNSIVVKNTLTLVILLPICAYL